MPDHRLIRLSIAIVWLVVQVLGGAPRQDPAISTVPFVGAGKVRLALTTLGLVESGLAV